MHARIPVIRQKKHTSKITKLSNRIQFAPLTVKQKNLAAVTDKDSTHQKGYQSKLLLVHLKGGQCNFERSS